MSLNKAMLALDYRSKNDSVLLPSHISDVLSENCIDLDMLFQSKPSA